MLALNQWRSYFHRLASQIFLIFQIKMQSIFIFAVLLIGINLVDGFGQGMRSSPLVAPSQLRSGMVSSRLYAKAPEPVSNGFWEGEWICADCGYIYDRDIDGGGLYFEG
jgi:hypothetical protein